MCWYVANAPLPMWMRPAPGSRQALVRSLCSSTFATNKVTMRQVMTIYPRPTVAVICRSCVI